MKEIEAIIRYDWFLIKVKSLVDVLFKLTNLGVWAMCFRCFDDESSSSLSGSSDTCNEDGDDGEEGGNDI